MGSSVETQRVGSRGLTWPAAAFAFGACEKHSADNLPDHYQHKAGQHAGAGEAHGAAPAPAHGETKKAPVPDHKG